ncbi:MAG: Crp/Fnr family transcriptional regulator [Rhodospirillales bacterium]|nr:MAG: Crp/Fnr family transcriptional regulator [Rhodospirillales bacterium]
MAQARGEQFHSCRTPGSKSAPAARSGRARGPRAGGNGRGPEDPTVRHVPRFTDIVVEGERSDGVLTLEAGWAFRYRLLGDGRRHIIDFLVPGDLVAPLSPMASHFVAALTDCTVRRHASGDLSALAIIDSPLAAALQRGMAGEMTRLLEKTVSLGRRNAKERMASLLVEMLQRTQQVGVASDGWFPFPVTQELLADALGLSIVHVNRTLRSLREDGLVDMAAGRVAVHDIEALMDLAGLTGADTLSELTAAADGRDVSPWQDAGRP